MKNLIVLLVLSCCWQLGLSQVEIRLYSGIGGTQSGNDISGTVHEMTATVNSGSVSQHFAIKNVSGVDQYLGIRRLKINVPADWQETLSYGQDPDVNFEGGCFGPNQLQVNPWNSPNATATNHYPTIDSGSIADLHLQYYINSVGTGWYRYYVIPSQTGQPIDSIDVLIESTLGVDDNDNVSIQVFPNPANNILTVTSTLSDDVVVKMTDVSGKLMLDTPLNFKNVDVSVYENGIYYIAFYDGERRISIEKIIIEH